MMTAVHLVVGKHWLDPVGREQRVGSDWIKPLRDLPGEAEVWT
jgi:hypothetical protein